jgi:hypothetical protein
MDPENSGHASSDFGIGIDPEQMRGILKHHLRVPGGTPFEVVKYKPSFTRGREMRRLFQYDVTLRDPDGREWNEVISGINYGGERTRKVWARLKLGDPGARREPDIRRAAYVPELDLLLEVFPFDHELPALEPLMAGALPELHDPIMARFGPGDRRLDEWKSESVRYRVNLRASVKLTVRASEFGSGRAAERRFFAKVYADAERAERAWKVQQDLATAIRAAREPIGLAPLVAYLPDERVLVQDEVEAPSLPEILLTRDPETVAEVVRRAARAIAALHGLSFVAPDRRIELDRTDPERVRRSAETLRHSRPDLAPVVAEIEAGILTSLAAFGKFPTVPVHGDLKLAHVLFGDDRVVFLDLDKFAAGEPMLDVVSVLMPLRTERRTRLAGTSLARVFAEEYFAHTPAAWEHRLAPHYAWALLSEAGSLASKPGKSLARSKISRSQKREERVDTLVEEAKAVLSSRT